MKKFFITNGRERDIVRFSEKSDQKDAIEIEEQDFCKLLINKGYSIHQAIVFINGVRNNPFNDWIEY